jgi:hypothetical protein
MDLAWPTAWTRTEEVVTDSLPIDLDAALVGRAQRGDRAAFEQLVRRHQRGMWHLARRYLRSEADASDATQQAFVRAGGARRLHRERRQGKLPSRGQTPAGVARRRIVAMTPTAFEELLARYAEDPTRLTPAERAAVEAAMATDEPDPATVALVRASAPAVAPPDWNALAASIAAATTRAPRRRWPLAVGGLALAVAAAAAVVVVRTPGVPLAWTAVAPTDERTDEPVPAVDVAVDGDSAVDGDRAPSEFAPDGEFDPAGMADLAGMGAIDDELIDAVLAADDERLDDDLPAVGATWTGWVDAFSDDELDRALAWLDSEEAG